MDRILNEVLFMNKYTYSQKINILIFFYTFFTTYKGFSLLYCLYHLNFLRKMDINANSI